MNLNIGPYVITQRTSYSKLLISDVHTGKNISEYDKVFINDVIKAYIEQNLHPERFYEINNNTLIKVNPDVSVDIKYLIVPDGITKIEKKAFEYSSVNFIGLPNTLKEIDDYAFSNCARLKYIGIPNSVEEIGIGIFNNCPDLEWAKLPNKLKVIKKFSFLNCSGLKNVYMPDTVTDINHSAFSGCNNLVNIRLSKNLKKIKYRAFALCVNLPEINLPDGLETIDEYAFSSCYSLEKINIPDSIKILCPGVFDKCSALNSVKLPKNLDRLETNMFLGCESLKNIILPDAIAIFGHSLFEGTEILKNINIPKSLKTIIKYPFYGSSIETITLNHNLEKLSFIDDDADYDLISKSKIVKIIIDKSVKTITPDAFRYSGQQITSINYLGTENEFKTFRNNNRDLFNVLPNATINIIYDAKEMLHIEMVDR